MWVWVDSVLYLNSAIRLYFVKECRLILIRTKTRKKKGPYKICPSYYGSTVEMKRREAEMICFVVVETYGIKSIAHTLQSNILVT